MMGPDVLVTVPSVDPMTELNSSFRSLLLKASEIYLL
jgi:hypothetical protein